MASGTTANSVPHDAAAAEQETLQRLGLTNFDPLDYPAYLSLATRHAHLAQRCGTALGYDPVVSPIRSPHPLSRPKDWQDLADLAGPSTHMFVFHFPHEPQAPWQQTRRHDALQFVATHRDFTPGGPEVIELTEADVPEMMELVKVTQPGPFEVGTIRMGRYVGIRREGELVAMAGTRLNTPGWTEVSAVATHPKAQGQGLAAVLVNDVCADIVANGDMPFLHTAIENTTAQRVYQRLGFEVRKPVVFQGVSRVG